MRTTPVSDADWKGVFPVPPLARRNEPARRLNLEANEQIVQHIARGGIKNFVYGGNAFLYHISLAEFEQLVAWLDGLPNDLWCIPGVGPSYGRAMDQAEYVQRHDFPCVMVLPSGDPRDAEGLEKGYREIADACEAPLLAYVKDETNLGADKMAGLDAVARLVSDGVVAGIKYAVVREDPIVDEYLQALLERVDKSKIISGIGERPAVVHMRDYGLPGFTTGSGCIAPAESLHIFEACRAADWATANAIRERFIPLEDLRDRWNPARVLHVATRVAGIADTGPMLPYLSDLSEAQAIQLAPVARALAAERAHA